jgi:hypothetical protein
MLNGQAAQLHFACPRGPLHARVRTGRHHARIGGHREKTLVAFVRSVNCVVHETVGASHAIEGFVPIAAHTMRCDEVGSCAGGQDAISSRLFLVRTYVVSGVEAYVRFPATQRCNKF